MKKISLYDPQKELIAQVRHLFAKRVRRVLLQSPTGTGKTVMMAYMALVAKNKGKHVYFLVHREELLDQASKTLTKFGVDHGLICPGMTKTSHLVQVAMVQTFVRRMENYPVPALIVVDECHHSPSATWTKILAFFHTSYVVGLSATPERLDGRGLGDQYDQMVLGKPVRWLIEQKYLSDYDIYAPNFDVDVDSMKTSGGDYSKSELSKSMLAPSITGDAVEHYLRIANGMKAIAFCSSIVGSVQLQDAFLASGVKARHIDGKEKKPVRKSVMKQFAEGDIMVLCTVDLISEGFDVPDAAAAILLRPTQSLGLFYQQVGRVLRYVEGKRAVILDHAGNTMRHGLPDQEREWSLDSKRRKKKKKSDEDEEVQIKRCPACFLIATSSDVCQGCGHVFKKKNRAITKKEGDLVLVTAETFEQKKERKNRIESLRREARSFSDFAAIANEFGYKIGWAYHQMKILERNSQPMTHTTEPVEERDPWTKSQYRIEF